MCIFFNVLRYTFYINPWKTQKYINHPAWNPPNIGFQLPPPPPHIFYFHFLWNQKIVYNWSDNAGKIINHNKHFSEWAIWSHVWKYNKYIINMWILCKGRRNATKKILKSGIYNWDIWQQRWTKTRESRYIFLISRYRVCRAIVYNLRNVKYLRHFRDFLTE